MNRLLCWIGVFFGFSFSGYGEKSEAAPSAQWYRTKSANNAEIRQHLEAGYLVSGWDQLTPIDPPPVRSAKLRKNDTHEAKGALELILVIDREWAASVTRPENKYADYVFAVGSNVLAKFPQPFLPLGPDDASADVSLTGFDAADGVIWKNEKHFSYHEKKALHELAHLHQLSADMAIDQTTGDSDAGLVTKRAKSPNEGRPPAPAKMSGWYDEDWDPSRLGFHAVISDDAFLLYKFPVKSLQVHLNAARFRVDTERDDYWWLETDFEWDQSGDILANFPARLSLALENGDAFRHETWRGYVGYAAESQGWTGGSQTLACGFENVEDGRRVIKVLREVHSNLPADAIIDQTKGEEHGVIQRYRVSHLAEIRDEWRALAESIRIPEFSLDEVSWLDVFSHIEAQSKAGDPAGIGVTFYVPGYREELNKFTPLNWHLSPNLSLETVLIEAVPPGWIYYPVSPRLIAVIPERKLFQDVTNE